MRRDLRAPFCGDKKLDPEERRHKKRKKTHPAFHKTQEIKRKRKKKKKGTTLRAKGSRRARCLRPLPSFQEA